MSQNTSESSSLDLELFLIFLSSSPNIELFDIFISFVSNLKDKFY